MRFHPAGLALLTLACQVALAQFPAFPEFEPARFPRINTDGLIFKPIHIHVFGEQCKKSGDGVYLKSGRTYYACIAHRDVCSEEKGAIPQRYITAFDNRMQVLKSRQSELRAHLDKPSIAPRSTSLASSAPLRAASTSAAPSAPRKPLLPDARLDEVPDGATTDDVVKLLGEPSARITGDFERFTYRLASGGSARLEFEAGKLTRRQVVR